MSRQCSRNAVLFRIELLVSIPILAMLAAGTAAAHPPEEVRYLPREGAVMVVWKGDAQGQITMKASGWDIYEDCDGFYFLAKPMTGDMTITVRLVSGPTETADGNGWNLAGPMIRESLDGRSRLIFAQMARDNPLEFKRRLEFGERPEVDQVERDDNTARPIWARLVRKGDNFSAFYSVDGKEFKELGPTRTVAGFAKEAYVGLAVTAHEDGEYTTAVLDNLTITQP